MLAYCIKDGEQQDAGEFLGLYLDALEEELGELHTYIVPSVKKLEKGTLSSEGQTEVGKRDDTVRRLFFLYELSLTLLAYRMDTNRQVQSSLPFRVSSVEDPV